MVEIGDGPKWLQEMDVVKIRMLQQRCEKVGADLIDMALQCDEWWSTQRTPKVYKKPRWYSRLSNWISVRERPAKLLLTDQPRAFQPPALQVRERRAVSAA